MEAEKIDAQFDRAVEIVQGLPKTGPIQTGYEEKLAMYSLYKQATVGDVQGSRPGMWDVLGRAKWDAWAKHKELNPYEAKLLYVETLMTVLRSYQNKTVAMDLVKELESYTSGGMSGSYLRSHEEGDSDSSGSSDEEVPAPSQLRRASLTAQQQQQLQQRRQSSGSNVPVAGLEGDADDEETDDDRVGNLNTVAQSLAGRPQSSMSSQRYRTPMGGSLIMSPPPAQQTNTMQMNLGTAVPMTQQSQYAHAGVGSYSQHPHLQQTYPYGHPSQLQHQSASPLVGGVPNVQPMPTYETPSAFEGPSPPTSSNMALPASAGTTMSTSSALTSPYVNVNPHPYPATMYPGHPAYPYRGPLPQPASSSASASASHNNNQSQQQIMSNSGASALVSPNTRSPLERAVEGLQAHLAALQERIEALEARSMVRSASQHSLFGGLGGIMRSSPPGSTHVWSSGAAGSSNDPTRRTWSDLDPSYFDRTHMGLWSTLLVPLARLTRFLLRIVAFLMQRDSSFAARPSPGLLVLRRLLLDASFLVCATVVARMGWRRSGERRREVVRALRGLWGALAGRGQVIERVLVDRGV